MVVVVVVCVVDGRSCKEVSSECMKVGSKWSSWAVRTMTSDATCLRASIGSQRSSLRCERHLQLRQSTQARRWSSSSTVMVALVNINFEVADVTRPLVAGRELQRPGMTVATGPHGSFVTRSQVTKPPGRAIWTWSY